MCKNRDDSPTDETSWERRFESPPLTPGMTYSYVVTAQWRGPDGRDVVGARTVSETTWASAPG